MTKSFSWTILVSLTGCIIFLVTGNSCKKESDEPSTAIQYEAVQYTIDQPDGSTIILQSRGTGNGTTKAFFDIYIEDGTGNVTAFRNDVWYTFNAVGAEDAINLGSNNTFVTGHIASIDSNYFVDVNGGADQGGLTYQFRTGSLQTMKFFPVQTFHPDTIYVHTATGGNIDIGKPGQWDNSYENSKGAIFWNGSTFTTNATAAHLYFTNSAGIRIKEHIVTEVPTTPGTFSNAPGYVITKTVYTYSAPINENGDLTELGTSFPVKFSEQFVDDSGEIQELRFIPALISETK